jgi:hypothetical protein
MPISGFQPMLRKLASKAYSNHFLTAPDHGPGWFAAPEPFGGLAALLSFHPAETHPIVVRITPEEPAP